MAEHTKGPWKLIDEPERFSPGLIVADSVGKGWHYGTIVHATQRDPHPIHGGGITHEESRANAERIVECVNALEGIKDPAALLTLVRHAASVLDHLVACESEAGGVGMFCQVKDIQERAARIVREVDG